MKNIAYHLKSIDFLNDSFTYEKKSFRFMIHKFYSFFKDNLVVTLIIQFRPFDMFVKILGYTKYR